VIFPALRTLEDTHNDKGSKLWNYSAVTRFHCQWMGCICLSTKSGQLDLMFNTSLVLSCTVCAQFSLWFTWSELDQLKILTLKHPVLYIMLHRNVGIDIFKYENIRLHSHHLWKKVPCFYIIMLDLPHGNRLKYVYILFTVKVAPNVSWIIGKSMVLANIIGKSDAFYQRYWAWWDQAPCG
jgi:hypothetical protein